MDILQRLLISKTEPRSLPDRIYEELLRDILTGQLPRDSRLNEPEICARYQASRTPVREAFRRLEMDGLCEYIPNRGEFVRGLTQPEIDDMLFMRADLEDRCVRWGIARITEEEEEELTEIFNHMEFYTKKGDVQKMVDINTAFHLMLYKTSHDRLLEKTLTAYQSYANYCAPPNYFARNFLKRVLEEHRRIYSAYMNKDVITAVRAMRLHMNNTLKRSNRPLKGLADDAGELVAEVDPEKNLSLE